MLHNVANKLSNSRIVTVVILLLAAVVIVLGTFVLPRSAITTIITVASWFIAWLFFLRSILNKL